MHRSGPTFLTYAALLGALALSACAGKQARTGGQAPEVSGAPTGPGELYDVAPPPQVGPEPDSSYAPPADSYVLVLGPGLARAFAYVGLLKEFEQKQVRIAGIVGVELGAVLASIWASSSVNNLEWKAHKFTRGTLLDFALLKLKSGPAPGRRIVGFMEDAIRVDDLSRMKRPVVVVSSSAEGPVFEKQGNPIEVLRGAIGIPNIIASTSVNGQERNSAGFEMPFPAEYARNMGIGKTICVDVLGGGNNFKPNDPYESQLFAQMRSAAVLSKELLKLCDETIHVPTDGMGYLDFEQKAELIFRGKVAAEKWIATKTH